MSSAHPRPHLAPAYQLALDLEAQGITGSELAELLGVPPEAVPSLLSVAHAKADAIDDGSTERPGTGDPPRPARPDRQGDE